MFKKKCEKLQENDYQSSNLSYIQILLLYIYFMMQNYLLMQNQILNFRFKNFYFNLYKKLSVFYGQTD